METSYAPTIAFETLTVSNSVKQLTFAKHTQQSSTSPDSRKTAKAALITVDGYGIRFTTDGTAPVATATGHAVSAGGSFVIHGYQNIVNLKMIRESGSDATVQVTYYGG
jgi:hypothetical protein